jgi:hypothetical protein
MDIDKITIQALRDFNRSIKVDLSQKGINDTSRASTSIQEKKISNTEYQSVGVDYLEILNRGRMPGKYVPVDVLSDWVGRKLGITDEGENRKVTYLINRKIKEKGTNIFLDTSKGIEVEQKVDKLKQDLKKNLPKAAKFEAMQVLNKFTKQFEEQNK